MEVEMAMNGELRVLTWALCVVFATSVLFSRASAQEERSAPAAARMSNEEAATLAARAASTPRLEEFSGGMVPPQIVLLPFFALLVAVSLIASFPIGLSHVLKGKTFIPKEIWAMEPGVERAVMVLGVTLGFPLYGLGYLAGLPCRGDCPEPPPAPAAEPANPPAAEKPTFRRR